ncbi:MAG: ATP-binding protein [Syntrophales bacterium]
MRVEDGERGMIISVASGKGGTGKTTVAVGLALSLNDVQFLDCDVEEPNAHLFLHPRITETSPAFIPIPDIVEAQCDYCGKCQEVCAFNSIAVLKNPETRKGSVLVFDHLCHGCGACCILCPRGAVRERLKEIGIVQKGSARNLSFVHGRLNIGEVMSPPLIRQVKKAMTPGRTIIIDAPPGTTCPVIEAVKGSDFCILVTEPTPFGLNDLALAVDVLKTLRIPLGIVLNRSDIGDDSIAAYARENNIPLLMSIPFDREIAVAYSRGVPMVDVKKNYVPLFRNLFERIRKAT